MEEEMRVIGKEGISVGRHITYDQVGICSEMMHPVRQQAYQIPRRHKQQPRLWMFLSHPVPQAQSYLVPQCLSEAVFEGRGGDAARLRDDDHRGGASGFTVL